MDFLNNLWGYSIRNAKAEAAELQAIMDREGRGEKLEAWDWAYYSEKLRKEKYDLNEDEVKPYFSQDDVWNGLCYVVNKLYGVTLTTTDSIPVYHPDVKTFVVKDADVDSIDDELARAEAARSAHKEAPEQAAAPTTAQTGTNRTSRTRRRS